MANTRRFGEEVRALMAKSTGNLLERIYGRELAGETEHPDYMIALGEFLTVHTLRNPDPPASWTQGMARASFLTFRTMVGYGDHHVSGTLKDWDIFDELQRIKIPTLVIGGEFDEAVPAHLADIARRIPDSEHVTQPGAGHMTYLEETPIREQYASIIRDYIAGIEARART